MTRRSNSVEELESRLAEALATVHDLRAENERLRALLVNRRSEPTVMTPNLQAASHMAAAGVDADSPETEKIALFRGLFRPFWRRNSGGSLLGWS